MPLKNNLKVYRSSAGSGKTFTLAKEYIKLLFANREVNKDDFRENYFKHILAITFTNDAANEMKSRVLDYLNGFVQNAPEKRDLRKLIFKELKEEYPDRGMDEKEINDRSKIILYSILHGYSQFHIKTIDSFTSDIGASFSRELGLPGGYEIYLDTQEKINESVEILLNRVGPEEKELSSWMIDFIENQLEDEKSWNIHTILEEFAQVLAEEDKQGFISLLKEGHFDSYKACKKELWSILSSIKSDYSILRNELLSIFKTYDLDDDDFISKSSGIGAWVRRNFKEQLKKAVPASYTKGKENRDWIHSKAKIEIQNQKSIINSELAPLLDRLEYFIQTQIPRYKLFINIAGNLYYVALLNELAQILKEIKVRDEQVFLQDLNEKIREVVINEPVPFIYEKAGVRFKNILIDEFQDTSLFQWTNLIPLLANSLSESQVCLLVGDAKQAIYAWRGGEAKLLNELPRIGINGGIEIEKYQDVFSNSTQIEALNSNWRSSSKIVEFNNSLFSHIRDNHTDFSGLSGFYDDIVQKSQKTKDAEIEIDIVNATSQGKNSISKEKLWDIKIDRILEIIDRCQMEMDYSLNEIAILVRKRDDAGIVNKALIEKEIPVISDESLLLSSSPVVQIIINVFRVINQSENQEYRADLIIQISSFLKMDKINWEEVIIKISNAGIDAFLDYVNELFGLSDSGSFKEQKDIYKIALLCIRKFHLDSEKGQQVYLDYFLDELYASIQKNRGDIASFLEYWEEKSDKLSIASSEEQNAVRITTIHKSKGLEYPIVIIPNLEWSEGKNSNKLWVKANKDIPCDLDFAVLNVNSDLEYTSFHEEYNEFLKRRYIENLNLLYVASTRAMNGLYILSSEKAGVLNKDFNKYIESQFEETKTEYEVRGFPVSRYSINKFESKSKEALSQELDFRELKSSDRISLNKHLKWSIDYTLSEYQKEQIKRGEAFHLLMSGFRTFSDLTEIKQKIESLDISSNNIKTFHGFLDKLKKSELRQFYESEWDKIYLEQDMMVDGNVFRPDRLQINQNELVIIDYKAGSEAEDHMIQLSAYLNQASILFNKEKVKGYLLYFEPFKIVILN